jgi:allantoicase
MNGSIMLHCLAVLTRSRITQTTLKHKFDGGYQRIRRYGRTNGCIFDLPRASVGCRIIDVSGQFGGDGYKLDILAAWMEKVVDPRLSE